MWIRDGIRTHRTGGTVANFSGFSRAAKAGLIIIAELLVALLDFHPYLPWHLKTLMQIDGKKHGSWCIPDQFHVQLSAEVRLLTGLAYGVDPNYMKRQIPFSRVPENQFYNAVKASSMTKSHAFLIRKTVRLSIFYVQAIEKLQSTLQYYSTARQEAMLTIVENPAMADGAPNPAPVSSQADLMLLQDIDYPFLANSLTNPRRIEMFQIIGEIACDLYQQNWHDLLTSKKYGPSQEHLEINMIPKSKSKFTDLIMGNIPSQRDLHWGFHEMLGETFLIDTPSKSKPQILVLDLAGTSEFTDFLR